MPLFNFFIAQKRNVHSLLFGKYVLLDTYDSTFS